MSDAFARSGLCRVAAHQSRTNSCSAPAQLPRRSEKNPGVPRILATPPHNLSKHRNNVGYPYGTSYVCLSMVAHLVPFSRRLLTYPLRMFKGTGLARNMQGFALKLFLSID